MVHPPYEVVLRLLGIAQDNWGALDGQAASQGQDFLTLPIDRFCNLIHWWALQHVKDPEDFERRLNKPAPGRQRSNPEAIARDMEDFTAFAAAFGVAPDAVSTA